MQKTIQNGDIGDGLSVYSTCIIKYISFLRLRDMFFNIAITHLFNYFTLSIKTIVISSYLG